jgi:hypothetical protein
VTAVEVFELAVSCYLREMDEAEFAAFTRRVRPPKPARLPAKSKRRNNR